MVLCDLDHACVAVVDQCRCEKAIAARNRALLLRVLIRLSTLVAAFAWCGSVAPSPAAWAEDRTAPMQGDYGQYFPRLVTRAMWQAKPALAGMIPQQPTSI